MISATYAPRDFPPLLIPCVIVAPSLDARFSLVIDYVLDGVSVRAHVREDEVVLDATHDLR